MHPDDPPFAQPEPRQIPTISTRSVAIAMIVAGLAIWLVAIAWPGWDVDILLLSGTLVR